MPDLGQVGADLVGAAGLQAHVQERGRGQLLDHREVGHRRPWPARCRWSAGARRRRSRPSGASMVPDGRRRACPPPAPGSGARAPGRRSPACRRSKAGSDLATTIRPDVSRSRRWTMPGRAGSSPPAARPASAPRQRRPAVARGAGAPPARRACRPPAGARPRRAPRTPAPRRAPRLSSRLELDLLPRAQQVALGARLPSTEHPPGVDQPLRLARVSSPPRARPAPRPGARRPRPRRRRNLIFSAT